MQSRVTHIPSQLPSLSYSLSQLPSLSYSLSQLPTLSYSLPHFVVINRLSYIINRLSYISVIADRPDRLSHCHINPDILIQPNSILPSIHLHNPNSLLIIRLLFSKNTPQHPRKPTTYLLLYNIKQFAHSCSDLLLFIILFYLILLLWLVAMVVLVEPYFYVAEGVNTD